MEPRHSLALAAALAVGLDGGALAVDVEDVDPPRGARVGQTLTFTLAQGPTRVRVIGIDTVNIDGGAVVYFPLPLVPARPACTRRDDVILPWPGPEPVRGILGSVVLAYQQMRQTLWPRFKECIVQ